MKFLVITAIKEFEKDIKVLLKKSGVLTFSYTNVTGYKNEPDHEMQSNWFASDVGESPSVLFYAIVPEDQVESVILWIDKFNSDQQSRSTIHVVTLDILKTNKLEQIVK